MTKTILNSTASIRKLSFDTLTTQFIKKNPKRKTPARFDLGIDGPLKLRVGSRSSNYYYRSPTNTQKLGDVLLLTLEDAHEMVRRIDSDEEIEHIQMPFAMTFEKFITHYEKKDIKHKQVITSIFNNHLKPAFSDTPIREITGKSAFNAIVSIQDNSGNSVAQKSLRFLKEFFSYLITKGDIALSPVAHLKAGSFNIEKVERERHLSIEEVRGFIAALDKTNVSKVAKIALQLQILLLNRVGELELAEWSEIDFRKRLWSVPASHTKSKRPCERALSVQAMNLFRELRELTGEHDLVLGGISKISLAKTLKKLQPKMVEAEVLTEDFKIHDLRRTGNTILAEFVQPHIISELLSHKKDSLNGIYNKFQYLDERREALILYANMVFQTETSVHDEVQNTLDI